MFSDYNEIKLEISNRRKFRKFTNMCKLDNTPLNNWWFRKGITGKLENTEINENTTYQNLRDAAKTVLNEKFML